MTPENRIELDGIFDNVPMPSGELIAENDELKAEVLKLKAHSKGLGQAVARSYQYNASILKEYEELQTELRELKAKKEFEKANHIHGKFEKDYQDLQKDNTELKAENERLITVIEKLEKDYEDSQIEAGSLKADRDWERANPKLGKVVTELKEQNIRLQADIEKLNIIIKDLKEDSQKWYKAFNSSQGICLDFITQNRLIREQLHGEGKVTAV